MRFTAPCLERPILSKAIIVRFMELPVGARFEFRGHRYEKVTLGFAADEDRTGNLFHADTEVVTQHRPAYGPADPSIKIEPKPHRRA